MENYNNIEGKQLLESINRLIQEHTLLNVSLPESDYESLTVLTEKKEENHQHYFQIDVPEGLMSASHPSPLKAMQFEYTGEGHLTHRFEAAIQDINEKSIWLAFPKAIQRFQLRNNFRIKVHHDSFADLEIANAQVRMEIDNLSVGGVYCYCANRHKSVFKVGAQFENMDLNITARRDCFIVQIDQALVKRIEPWMRPKHFGVAFQFVQIQKSARQQLIRRIYELQRDFLQGRLKLDD